MACITSTERKNIENWVRNTDEQFRLLASEEKYDIIYNLKNNWECLLGSIDDEKENGTPIFDKKEDTLPKAEEESALKEECTPACSMGPAFQDVQFWSTFSDVHDKILRPRLFQNHRLSAEVIEENQKNNYTILENLNCPQSAPEYEMNMLHLPQNRSLREACLEARYIRMSVAESFESFMCRMCPHKKWIPIEWFEDHMAAAHGIVAFEKSAEEEEEIMAIPDPRALFCLHFTKGLKRYHCQCPQCSKWVRLGFPEFARTSSSRESPQKTISLEEMMKRGLYTNYYLHFMKCEQNTPK